MSMDCGPAHCTYFSPSGFLSQAAFWLLYILMGHRYGSLSQSPPALTGQLSWLERYPNMPRLQVQSPIRAHTSINPWPWLVWLNGLSTSLRAKGSPVRFSLKAHAWVVGQVPSRGSTRGNHTLMFLSLSPSLPPCLKINKIFRKH